MKNSYILFIILVASFAISIYFYPSVDEMIATHWNIDGEVDGYMPKLWGMFLIPILSVVLFLIFMAIPRIDPLKKDMKSFRRYFDFFVAIVLLFLLYIQAILIAWNIGFRFDFLIMIIPAISILIYAAGVLMEKSQRNWFIGMRTPWTLSNDHVWNKTNEISGKLFKISAVITLLGIYFVDYAFFIFLAPVLASSIFAIIYSYYIYTKMPKKKTKK